ncbi:Acg family FMN-binding oxidoreductase [Pseudonocardia sp. GCM10023141]|uniref:Acg family FMN-binding oxidoreductase n=1 Tax=Pseudonocardia sp. GCM10023141 TaxID=3252653 RepID=UPI003617758E
MIVEHTVDRRTLRSAIELACHAPSLHNSQPWRWLIGPHTAHLYADLRRWLPATDSEGRDLVISCGAALHHLRVALAASGVTARVHRLPNPGEEYHIASLELRTGIPADADLSLASAITARRTDRRLYGDWPVPTGFVENLVTRAAAQGAVLRPIGDGRSRDVVVAALAAAAAEQDATPGYRAETALWTGRSACADGIPATNLLRDAAGTGDGTAREFTEGLIEQRWARADGASLFVLGTASDDRLSQLRAGEALSAVLLHATELGLATCPLSQPLEVDATRMILRDEVLGGTLSPQLVLRIGWAVDRTSLPATPRRPLDETVELLPC